MLFILRKIREEFRGKEKMVSPCFVDFGKAFNRVPRKVAKWARRKKGLQEVLVRAVMSLYKGLRTNVGGGSRLLEEFGESVGAH